MIPVFDGHNDLLLRLVSAPDKAIATWNGHGGRGHLDLPRMKAGGFVGGLFAIFVPSPPSPDEPDWPMVQALMANPPFSVPMPAPLVFDSALAQAREMAALLRSLEETGTLAVCLTVAEIRAAITAGKIAAVMHIEGAEPIDEGVTVLEEWHALGLRSIGPTWSRNNVFAHGVPFRFPGDPDDGPGLTDAGKRLIRECNRLRMVIDLSHLNEKGFDDIAALSDAPLVASHSNAHAVTPSSRNLTDRQLAVIRESGGLVGLNFATVFLNENGSRTTFSGWDPLLRHLDHLITHLGEDHVGLGSDFDGAEMPASLGDVAGLPDFLAALAAHGYDEQLLAKIAGENWLALLERTWGA
ncbi:MAG: dipeptidase [Paracoccaceae bacterium]